MSICGVITPLGTCNRQEGHEGQHIERDETGRIVAKWHTARVAPKVCGNVAPSGGYVCDLQKGHDGHHWEGPSISWPQEVKPAVLKICGHRSKNGSLCELRQGHTGSHCQTSGSIKIKWPNGEDLTLEGRIEAIERGENARDISCKKMRERLDTFDAEVGEISGKVDSAKVELAAARRTRGAFIDRFEAIESKIERARADRVDIRESVEKTAANIRAELKVARMRIGDDIRDTSEGGERVTRAQGLRLGAIEGRLDDMAETIALGVPLIEELKAMKGERVSKSKGEGQGRPVMDWGKLEEWADRIAKDESGEWWQYGVEYHTKGWSQVLKQIEEEDSPKWEGKPEDSLTIVPGRG